MPRDTEAQDLGVGVNACRSQREEEAGVGRQSLRTAMQFWYLWKEAGARIGQRLSWILMKIQKCLCQPSGEFWREYCLSKLSFIRWKCHTFIPLLCSSNRCRWIRKDVTLNKEVLCSFDFEGAGHCGHITYSQAAYLSLKGHLGGTTQCLWQEAIGRFWIKEWYDLLLKRIIQDTLWRIDLRKNGEEAWRLVEKLML